MSPTADLGSQHPKVSSSSVPMTKLGRLMPMSAIASVDAIGHRVWLRRAR
jgi:hypothetical protein